MKSAPRVILATAACLAVVLGSVAIFPATPAAAETSGPPPYVPGQIIVEYKAGTGEVERAEFKRSAGLTPVKTIYDEPDLEVLALPAGRSVEESVTELAQASVVESVQANYTYTVDAFPPPDHPNDPLWGELWGLDNVAYPSIDLNVQEAWIRTQGAPTIVVGVIDTGIAIEHEDLAGNIYENPADPPDGVDNDGNGLIDDTWGWDFGRGEGTVYHEFEEDYHGTHVAGTIAATVHNAIGVAGVAPEVTILPLKFIRYWPDGYLYGLTADAVSALNYAMKRGVKIINASWGGGPYDPLLVKTISKFGSSGGVFVAAAGNDGVNTDYTPHYPSSYDLPNIVSVAAVGYDGSLASFSNYGIETVDLGAPGVNIVSTLPIAPSETEWGYGALDGTSMATPHVSGTVALMLTMNPALKPPAVREILMDTSTYLSSLAGTTACSGMVNAAAALECAWTSYPMPPTGVKGIPSWDGVRLTWQAPKKGPVPEGYEVYVAPSSSGVWEKAGDDVTEWDTATPSVVIGSWDYDFEPGQKYFFRIYSYVGTTEDRLYSSPSGVASSLAGPVPPAAPSGLRGRPTGKGVHLTWKASPFDWVHYKVYISDGVDWYFLKSVDDWSPLATPNCEITPDDLLAAPAPEATIDAALGAGPTFYENTKYKFMVTSYFDHPTYGTYESPKGATTTCLTGPGLPSAPSGLKGTPCNDGVLLTWKEPSSQVKPGGYRIALLSPSGWEYTLTEITVWDGATPNLMVPATVINDRLGYYTPGSKYTFLVYSLAWDREDDEWVSLKPAKATAIGGPVPLPPLWVKCETRYGIRITWHPPKGELPDYYHLYWGYTKTGAFYDLGYCDAMSYDIIGTTMGRTYWFRVYSTVWDHVNGMWVDSLKFTTASGVAGPEG